MKPSKRVPQLLSVIAMASLLFSNFALDAFGRKQEPEPRVVDPGPVGGQPSDAIVLFDGKSLSKFRGERSVEPKWKVENGVMETTPFGGIFSKEEFSDCQLHVEWASPSSGKGEGQGRGTRARQQRRLSDGSLRNSGARFLPEQNLSHRTGGGLLWT